MKKILLMMAAVLVLSVSAFADSEVYFAPLPYDSNYRGNINTSTTESPNVYCFFRLNSRNKGYFYCISTGSGARVINSLFANGNIDVAFGNYFIANGWGEFPQEDFVNGTAFSSPITAYFDADATDEDIQQAFAAYLNSSAPTVTTRKFTIPRGNVAYIQVPSSQTLTLTSTFMQYSNLAWVQYGPWGDTGQRVGTSSALPTSTTVFPLSGSSAINWIKKPPVDLLGRTKTGTATVSASSGQYLVIYNPTWSYLTENLRDGVGASITVEGVVSSVRVYPLTQELTISNATEGLTSSSNDGYTSYYDATFTDDGNAEWANQDGDVAQPVNGGQNKQDDPISAADLIDNIIGLLKKIVENIESVFTFGYEAIQELAGLMSGFVSVFSSLYNWLPQEIHAALISAVSVAIMIGVFKVFL